MRIWLTDAWTTAWSGSVRWMKLEEGSYFRWGTTNRARTTLQCVHPTTIWGSSRNTFSLPTTLCGSTFLWRTTKKNRTCRAKCFSDANILLILSLLSHYSPPCPPKSGYNQEHSIRRSLPSQVFLHFFDILLDLIVFLPRPPLPPSVQQIYNPSK